MCERAAVIDPLARPIFIVAPPQSGTRFLHRALGEVAGIRALGRAARGLLDQDEGVDLDDPARDSNRRTAADATPELSQRLRARLRELLAEVEAAEGARVSRIVDATPRNALRVPFLDAIFPDSTFVYLYREPRDTLAGMLEAWHSDAYTTYPDLPGWPGPPWSMLLVPGWRKLAGAPLPEIVTDQWMITTATLLDDLGELPPERWCVVDYAALEADPEAELERLANYLGIERPASWPASLAEFVEIPRSDEALRRSEGLQQLLPRTIGLAERAHELIAEPVSRRPTPTPDAESPLRSVYTGSFARILGDVRASLLVTSPSAGRLIAIRRDGPRVNTHFRRLPSPSGLAVAGGRMAVATPTEIHLYRDAPGANGADHHDALFLPTGRCYTGAAAVGELAYVGDALWLVPGRFSCIATVDDAHSFVPRWKPGFIDEIDGEDRCRTSGLAIVDGEPAYVTALGQTDEPGGWRAGGRGGGCVISIADDEVIADGLSLPHSPRWHDGRLWVLESGEGRLLTVDVASGATEIVVELPGFARGLALHRDLAFVGLSKLRQGPAEADEEALGVAERFEERFCGVWIVNLARGEVAGFLRFEDEIDEIASVELLEGVSFPEVADPAGELAGESFSLPEP